MGRGGDPRGGQETMKVPLREDKRSVELLATHGKRSQGVSRIKIDWVDFVACFVLSRTHRFSSFAFVCLHQLFGA